MWSPAISEACTTTTFQMDGGGVACQRDRADIVVDFGCNLAYTIVHCHALCVLLTRALCILIVIRCIRLSVITCIICCGC